MDSRLWTLLATPGKAVSWFQGGRMEKKENSRGKGRWIALAVMFMMVFWFVWMGRARIKAAPTE